MEEERLTKVALDPLLRERFHAQCQRHGLCPGRLIANLIREYLDRKGVPTDPSMLEQWGRSAANNIGRPD